MSPDYLLFSFFMLPKTHFRETQSRYLHEFETNGSQVIYYLQNTCQPRFVGQELLPFQLFVGFVLLYF